MTKSPSPRKSSPAAGTAPDGGASANSNTPSASDSSPDALQESNNAAQLFFESIAKLTEAVRERQEQDGAKYSESFKEVLKQVQTEALTHGQRDLANAITDQDSGAHTAQAAYSATVKKAQTSLEAGYKSALSDYLNSTQNLMQEVRNECLQYYLDYVRDLKAALNAAPDGDLVPSKLAGIGQAIVAVAAIALSVTPQEARLAE